MIIYLRPFLIFMLMTLVSLAHAQTRVEYNLIVKDTIVQFSGKKRHAIAVNGKIPAPALMFIEGDHAVIHVKNEMDEETSVHWHGLLLPNLQDGVPYVTTPPILPGATRTFEFPIKQAGTYWYHSHTNLQEQSGLYGSIVIHPKKEMVKADKELVLLLSDWTDEKPEEVMRTLKRGLEWYGIKKKQPASWNKIIANGGFKNRIRQSWDRMPLMDISDVYYNAFLINGRQEQQLTGFQPGEKVRLRVINGSASSYFNVQFAGGTLTAIAADGLDIEPVVVGRALISIAETYDFVITIPEDGMAYEFRATAQDGSGYASAFLGGGIKMKALDILRPNIYNMSMMDMMMTGPNGAASGGMEMGGMSQEGMKMPGKTKMEGDDEKTMLHEQMKMPNDTMQGMDMIHQKSVSGNEPDMRTLNYDMLRSLTSTALPAANEWREIRLELTGNMWRYVWSLDGKTLTEADKIIIRKGDNVRFILVNKSMMNHPMHLHGHFFRVLNGQGDYAPLKHTVNVPPMGTVTLEFHANEEKDWFFHCHILYHMMTGMARVVSYEGSTVALELAAARKDIKEKMDNQWFFWGMGKLHNQLSEWELTLSNTRNQLNLEADGDWKGNFDVDTDYERYLGQNGYFRVFAGATVDGKQVPVIQNSEPASTKMEEDIEVRPLVGVRYLLPFFINSELRIDSKAKVRLQLNGETLLFPRLGFRWLVNTDKEWRAGLEGILTKNIVLSGNYDNRYGWGGGLTLLF